MKLIGFSLNNAVHIGAVTDDKVTDLGTVHEFYRNPAAALQITGEATYYALGDVEQLPPVPETARIFCVGINYHSHGDESKTLAGLDIPKVPMIFGRWASTLVTDGVPVPVPPNEPGLDWEVELAAVIGETVWQATEEDALSHVLGYTAFNDLSARRKQLETAQFTLGKNADRSGPIGPVLVTSDELPDPRGLRVQTRVNGATVQDGNTSDLIHSVGKIIAYISDTVTLRPGDVIATGTPGGVGAGMQPPRYLTPGDVVEVEVDKIGVVRTPIVERAEIQGDLA